MVYWEQGSEAYTGPYNVWRVEGNGPPQELPVHSGGSVSLSPDGGTVAYTPYSSGTYHLVLSDIYGQNRRTIYSAPAGPYTDYVNKPEWSPDGQSLVFECSTNINPTGGHQAICAVNRDGTGFRRIVDRGTGLGMSPSYSPDGTKLTFMSDKTNSGSPLTGLQIFRANADGSNPSQLTTSSSLTEAYHPAYGPGGQIALVGCKVKRNQLCDVTNYEIYTIQDNGTNLRRLTTNVTYEDAPNWFTSSSGPRIVYNDGASATGSFSSMRPDGTDRRSEGGSLPTNGFDAHFAANSDNAGQLLQRYVPVLRYYPTETYRADSVREITDNYALGGLDETNKLQVDPADAIATANPMLGYPQLSLSFLGQRAAGTDTSSDWIDERNNYAADAQQMHGNPYYGDHVYGRALSRPGGGWVLQYWMFYYYNPKTYLTFGEHEGDWEMMQLEVTSAGVPIRASYSQHAGGETCDWVHVPRDQAQRPIVYVAEGSHANYFSPGYHFNSFAEDYTSDQGEQVANLQLTNITSLAPQPWVQWRGKYGASNNSPGAPITQGNKWDDPLSWAGGVDGCTEGQTFP